MTHIRPRRRAMLAYAAGFVVIAALMSLVVVSGGTNTARKTVIDAAPAHITAAKQP